MFLRRSRPGRLACRPPAARQRWRCATDRRWSSGRSAAPTRRCWPTASPGSAPSRGRLRFLRRKDELSAAELRYFTDIDHHDHEALGAVDHADGRGVGVARYVRDASDPHSAEIALTVVDDWQGRGLGTELLAQLSGRARAEGIRRFTALVSADNAAMTALLRGVRAGPVHREYGTVEYEIPLAPAAESSSDRQRAVGGHDGRGQGGGSHQVAVERRPLRHGPLRAPTRAVRPRVPASPATNTPSGPAPKSVPRAKLPRASSRSASWLGDAAVVLRAGEAQREQHQIGRDLPLGARLGPPLLAAPPRPGAAPGHGRSRPPPSGTWTRRTPARPRPAPAPGRRGCPSPRRAARPARGPPGGRRTSGRSSGRPATAGAGHGPRPAAG